MKFLIKCSFQSIAVTLRHFVVVASFLALCSQVSCADDPEAPLVLTKTDGSCFGGQEVCGDGVDQDCDGSDLQCPGADRDRDGFASGQDCDDSNRRVYPGVSVSCSASCGQGTRTCQSNGTLSPCSCSPLCEATGGGKCYYISKLTGNDSGPGTFAAPWKTVKNITSYYSPAQRPSTAVNLAPGDVVYFMAGVYDETYNFDPNIGDDKKNLFLYNVRGTSSAPIRVKAYPGARATFISRSTIELVVEISRADWIRLEGLEIGASYAAGGGVFVSEATNIDLANLWVHDVDGSDNSNVAGVKLTGVTNARLHHSIIHDNYDHANSDTNGEKTENSRNVVVFSGGNIRIDHNTIFNSLPISDRKGGGCIGYKHRATVAGSTFEVDHNVLRNCSDASVASATANTRVHHNLVIDSAPVNLRNLGGGTEIRNVVVEYNTFVRSVGMYYKPNNETFPVGQVTFRKNVIMDNQRQWQERCAVTIDPYGSNAIYQATYGAGLISVNENCYFNAASPLCWCLFCDTSFGQVSTTFSHWQGKGFDQASTVADPQLDSNFVPSNATCRNWGMYAGE